MIEEALMAAALEQARIAASRGEVPVGAVAEARGEIIGRGHNLRELAQDPTAHAEIIALRQAAHRIGSWRLEAVTLYVTLEPCPMCAGALVNARVPRVVYGCDDPKAGATTTLFQIGSSPHLNHRFEVVRGICEEECKHLLSNFFRAIRSEKKRELTG